MKTIGIYPGLFQPAHRGHLVIYKKLKQISGSETFIVTSDKTPTPDFPLNFGEKQQILVRHGIPVSHIINSSNPTNPNEVFNKFSSKHTAAVFSFGEKEDEKLSQKKGKDDEGHEIWLDSNGAKNYYQPYKGNESNMEGFDKYGYVIVVDDIRIDGKPISSSNVREVLGSEKYTDQQKKKFFQWAFGWFDISLYRMMVDKFKYAHQSSISNVVDKMPSMASMIHKKTEPLKKEPFPEDVNTKLNPSEMTVKEQLRKAVSKILKELMGPIPSGNSTSSTDQTDLSSSNLAQQELQTRQAAAKAKSQAERDLKTLQTDLKWKDASIRKLRKDDLPNKRKEIDDLNKSITTGQPSSSTTSTSSSGY